MVDYDKLVNYKKSLLVKKTQNHRWKKILIKFAEDYLFYDLVISKFDDKGLV